MIKSHPLRPVAVLVAALTITTATTQDANAGRDRTPPSISVTNPIAGATVAGIVLVAGIAADNQSVRDVSVSVDSGSYQIATGTTAWVYSLNTSTLANGTHTLVARARDRRNSTSTTVPFVVQNSAPSPSPTPTPSPSPSPTPSPSPSPSPTPSPTSALWKAGMEGGSLSEWSANGGGGLFNSGTYNTSASTAVAHSGSYSLRAEITTPPQSGVRAFRWAEPRAHRDAYYSIWMYIPTEYTLTGGTEKYYFLNLFQFKSRSTGGRNDPIWGLYAKGDGAGHLYLRAGWGWGGTTLAGPHSTDGVSGKWLEPASRVTLPVGRWFHLEAFLHQSKDFDGRLTFWQDGAQLFDFTNIRTSYNNCNYNSWCAANEWSANLYSDGTSPNPAVVYMDDAAISKSYIP